jgi:hypothetical protein
VWGMGWAPIRAAVFGPVCTCKGDAENIANF